MLDRIRDAHDALDQSTGEVVREITNLAATMKVLESVDEAGLEDAFDATERTLCDLSAFLEVLAKAVDRLDSDQLRRDDLREELEELEPLPGPDAGEGTPPDGSSDDDPDEASNPFENIPPLRRLSAPSSVLLNLERDLYAERIRRPFRLRKLKELWGDLNRTGSSHPSEGLVARLGRLQEYFGPDQPRTTTAIPWSESDRSAVESLADRTREIREWDDETRGRLEREAWVGRVKNWVETAESEPGSVAQMEEMLTRFLTDLPRQQTPDVRMLLERILELEQLPATLQRQTERALETD